MRKNRQFNRTSLIYDDRGTQQVSEQIMNSYRSGCINKQGFHGDLGRAAHNK